MTFAAGVISGVVGTVVFELVVATIVWLWLTRGLKDAPQEID